MYINYTIYVYFIYTYILLFQKSVNFDVKTLKNMQKNTPNRDFSRFEVYMFLYEA